VARWSPPPPSNRRASRARYGLAEDQIMLEPDKTPELVSRSIAAFASSIAASGLGQAKPALSVENNAPLMTIGCLSARPNLACQRPRPSSKGSISKS
jgi:hypothetical protein